MVVVPQRCRGLVVAVLIYGLTRTSSSACGVVVVGALGGESRRYVSGIRKPPGLWVAVADCSHVGAVHVGDHGHRTRVRSRGSTAAIGARWAISTILVGRCPVQGLVDDRMAVGVLNNVRQEIARVVAGCFGQLVDPIYRCLDVLGHLDGEGWVVEGDRISRITVAPKGGCREIGQITLGVLSGQHLLRELPERDIDCHW